MLLQGQWDGVVAARVESTAGFTLTELAVESGPCTQWASVDMQQARQVGMIRVRFWAPDAAETKLLTSVDGQSWTLLRVRGGGWVVAVGGVGGGGGRLGPQAATEYQLRKCTGVQPCGLLASLPKGPCQSSK